MRHETQAEMAAEMEAETEAESVTCLLFLPCLIFPVVFLIFRASLSVARPFVI